MRIGIVATPGTLGAIRLCRAMAARGHEVTFLTSKPVSIPQVSVEVMRTPPFGLRHPYRYATRRRQYLMRLVRQVDVLAIFFLHDWGFDEEMLRSVPVIARALGSDIITPPGSVEPSDALQETRRMMLHAASMVAAPGPHFREVLADYAGMSSDEIVLLPLGVDTQRFQPKAVRKLNPAGGWTVGYCKGFKPVYDPQTLFRAMPLIHKKMPSVQFEVVGRGPEWNACRALADATVPAGVIRWVDAVPHDAMHAVLQGWDLSVICSVSESFGVAALESAATGVPVVATDVCGLKDTVPEGVCGHRFEAGCHAALAASVCDMLNDPTRLQMMSRLGRAFVKKDYEEHAMFDRWEQAFYAARERKLVMI